MASLKDELFDYAIECFNKINNANISVTSDFLSEDYDDENVNEVGSVAAFPLVMDIKKLYNDICEIIKHDKGKHIPETSKVRDKIETIIPFLSGKEYDAYKHTIIIPVNDPAYKFKDFISMPNSVFKFDVTNFIIDDEFIASLTKDPVKTNFYMRSKYDNINDKNEFEKAMPETIGIMVTAVNDKVSAAGFYNKFFHEYNHLVQDYLEHFHVPDKIYDNVVAYKKMRYGVEHSDEFSATEKKKVNSIVYILLNDTEVNAHGASMFGELLGAEIQKFEYEDFLRRSKLWEIISKVSDNVEYVTNMSDEQLTKIYKLLVASEYNKCLSRSKNVDAFRNKFRKNVTERLKKLIRITTKAAGTYFKMIEAYPSMIS